MEWQIKEVKKKISRKKTTGEHYYSGYIQMGKKTVGEKKIVMNDEYEPILKKIKEKMLKTEED